MLLRDLAGLLTAFGASGIATALTTFLTGKRSGVKSQVEAEKKVDDSRRHLEDEVHWLRQQLAVEKGKHG